MTLPTEYLRASEHIWPALKAFPSDFSSFFSSHPLLSLQSWITYYATADPLHTAIVLCTVTSAAVYIAQQATGNASQVDRIWTFAPVWYGAHFVLQPVVAAKLVAYGLVKEPASDPLGNLALLGKRYLGNLDVSATLQPRLALMLALQLIWCTRLTYNAWRRGFFKPGEEDYRWPELRKGMNRIQWELFSFFFIAIIQNILLAITALPQYLLLTTTFPTSKKLRSLGGRTSQHLQLTTADYVVAVVFLATLFIEFIADHQQQVYQNWKRGLASPLFGLPYKRKGTSDHDAVYFDWRKDDAVFTEDDRKRGFVTRGLWAWSRHPNFACEQSIWWLLFLFVPITFSGPLLGASTLTDAVKYGHALFFNYALLAPASMSLLFFASTDFTEKMSAAKYPQYHAYKRRVGMFSPIDTLLRAVYYKVAASKQDKEKVEADVWGHVGKTQ